MDIRRFIYLKVNSQQFQVLDTLMFEAALIQQPAEIAMRHFGPLEADEDIFVLVDTDWTHNFHNERKH
jgi:hypothetical protein